MTNTIGVTTLFEQRAVDHCPVHDVPLKTGDDILWTLPGYAHRSDYCYGCIVCQRIDDKLDREEQERNEVRTYQDKLDMTTEAMYRALTRMKAEGKL